MLFRAIAAIVSVAFVSQGANAQVTVDGVVGDIETLIGITVNATSVLSEITGAPTLLGFVENAVELTNSKLVIIDRDVSAWVVQFDTTTAATPSFRDCTATEPIPDALANLVGVMQTFMSTAINAHLPLAQFVLTAPFLTNLIALKNAIDTYFSAIIGLLSACDTSRLQQYQSQLDNSFGAAIPIYEQVCIPNPLWPSFPPTCAS